MLQPSLRAERLRRRPCRLHERGTMPFRSQAQRRKFAQLLVEGKISDQTFEEWNRETGSRRLPERVVRRAGASARSKTKRPARRQSAAARQRPSRKR